MKTKLIILLVVVCMCFSLTACEEVKRPIDCPNTKWSCDIANINFSVSDDCKITDATMVDKNGETISISLVFSDMEEAKISITNVDGSETYLEGTCAYDTDMFSVFVTDIYNTDLDISAAKLTFKRV